MLPRHSKRIPRWFNYGCRKIDPALVAPRKNPPPVPVFCKSVPDAVIFFPLVLVKDRVISPFVRLMVPLAKSVEPLTRRNVFEEVNCTMLTRLDASPPPEKVSCAPSGKSPARAAAEFVQGEPSTSRVAAMPLE